MPSCQLFCLARLALPFLSIRPFRCVHPFVSTLPSYLIFLSFRFNSHLTFHRKLEKIAFLVWPFGLVFAVQATTCGHLRPLAPAATCGHLRPLEWLQVAASGCKWLHASGCKWLQIMQMAASDAVLEISNPTSRVTGHVRPRLAATCGHLRPLAATCGHSSGCKCLQVPANDANNASGCK